jgi:hypothetical protein
MITRESFSVEEWAQILSAPSAVGALVVTADPSGPLGLISEFKAIMNSMKAFVEEHAGESTLMAVIKDHMATRPSEEEEAQLKEWAQQQQAEMEGNKPQTQAELQEHIRSVVSTALDLLKSKGASDDDLNLFKQMAYEVAEAVAGASKEGGFLGFGGVRVSDKEASMLAQIKTELGV